MRVNDPNQAIGWESGLEGQQGVRGLRWEGGANGCLTLLPLGLGATALPWSQAIS